MGQSMNKWNNHINKGKTNIRKGKSYEQVGSITQYGVLTSQFNFSLPPQAYTYGVFQNRLFLILN